MQRQAVHHRGHGELAHAVVDVVARGIRSGDRTRVLAEGVHRAGEIRRPTDQLAHARAEYVENGARGCAGCLATRHRERCRDCRIAQGRPVRGQSALHATGELSSELREFATIAVEAALPGFLGPRASCALIPRRAQFFGYDERLVRPAECRTRGSDFLGAQRLTVGRLAALLVRRTIANHGARANQRRLAAFAARTTQRLGHGLAIVPIDILDDLPSVGREPLGRIVGHPALHGTVNRDAIVVVDADELAETECAGERGRFVGDAFHHAAVA